MKLWEGMSHIHFCGSLERREKENDSIDTSTLSDYQLYLIKTNVEMFLFVIFFKVAFVSACKVSGKNRPQQ